MTQKEQKKIEKLNSKVSHIINMIVALGMYGESIAVDLGIEIEEFKIIRSFANIKNGVAEEFGIWAERVESELKLIAPPHKMLPAISERMFNLAIKMQDVYRQYEPNFDFYNMNDIKQLRTYAFNIDSEVYLKVISKTNELMIE